MLRSGGRIRPGGGLPSTDGPREKGGAGSGGSATSIAIVAPLNVAPVSSGYEPTMASIGDNSFGLLLMIT